MKYDCIVIGAGISGLSCAAFIAKAGKKVILIERSEKPGGYFSSFEYNGYHFDSGIKAVENAGLLFPMLENFGIMDKLNFVKNRVYAGFEDKVFSMESDESLLEYFDFLGERFPESRSGIEDLLKEMQELNSFMGSLSGMSGPLYGKTTFLTKLKSIPWFLKNGKKLLGFLKKLKYNNIPFRDFLKVRIPDDELVSIIDEPFFEGTPAFFGLAYPTVFRDYFYPRGGIEQIPLELAEFIRKSGGTVLTNTEVTKILLERSSPAGVVTDTGQEIESPVIVNAADAKRLYNKLLPENSVDQDFLQRLNRAQVSDSVFSVFMGVDTAPENLDQHVEHIIYVPAAAKPCDYESPEYFKTTGMEISIPCMRDPSLAPAGKTGVILNVNTTQKALNGWGRSVSRAEYERLKEQAADDVMANFFRLYPSLREKIEFRIVATPFTMEEKTLNSGGSITGWNYHPSETFPLRDFRKMKRSIDTPVKNLFQIGQWSFDPAGVPVCLITAKLAADRVLNISRP